MRITRLSGGTVEEIQDDKERLGIPNSYTSTLVLTAIHGELNDLRDLATILGYSIAAR